MCSIQRWNNCGIFENNTVPILGLSLAASYRLLSTPRGTLRGITEIVTYELALTIFYVRNPEVNVSHTYEIDSFNYFVSRLVP